MKDPEKTLHATVPAAILARAEELAARDHITLDELISEAMERHLHRRGLDDVLAFGKRHTRERGIKPDDVEKAISRVRKHDHER